MTDPSLLFAGSMKASTGCYLRWDRASALADFVIRKAGTLEVPLSFDVPVVEFLPDTMPRYPRSHDKYYADGGMNFPDRYVVSVNGLNTSATESFKAY